MFLLLVEAVIGFGPPAIFLLAGLPLLLLFTSSRVADAGNDLGIGLGFVYLGGVLGIAGAVILIYRAMRPRTPPRPAPLILLLTCCGIASLAAAISWLGDLPPLMLLLTLAVALHFAHLAMAQSLPLTTASFVRDFSLSLLVISIPVALFFVNQDRIAEAVADERDPCFGLSPRVGLSLHVNLDEAEWPAFAAIMGEFAGEQGLRLYDGSETHGDASNMLYLSLCDEAGIQLMTDERHWRIGPEWDWQVDNDVEVRVHARDVASNWPETVDALERRLETAWPGRVTLEDSSAGAAE
jgi:hypothetical protein